MVQCVYRPLLVERWSWAADLAPKNLGVPPMTECNILSKIVIQSPLTHGG